MIYYQSFLRAGALKYNESKEEFFSRTHSEPLLLCARRISITCPAYRVYPQESAVVTVRRVRILKVVNRALSFLKQAKRRKNVNFAPELKVLISYRYIIFKIAVF